jgi:hypothetical protein
MLRQNMPRSAIGVPGGMAFDESPCPLIQRHLAETLSRGAFADLLNASGGGMGSGILHRGGVTVSISSAGGGGGSDGDVEQILQSVLQNLGGQNVYGHDGSGTHVIAIEHVVDDDDSPHLPRAARARAPVPRPRQRVYGQTTAAPALTAGTASDIARIGVPTEGDVNVRAKNEQKSRSDVCVICLQHFQSGDSLGELRCKHAFHSVCIERWLNTRGSTQSCPVCRASA